MPDTVELGYNITVEGNQTENTGKRYNEEFKADIIRLVREEKRSVASIEKDFCVNDQTVRNWLKESKDKQDPDKVRIAELEAELKEASIAARII